MSKRKSKRAIATGIGLATGTLTSCLSCLPAHSQVATFVQLEAANSSNGTFSVVGSNLGNSSLSSANISTTLASGNKVYNYASTTLSLGGSGLNQTWYFGQKSSPVDTAMILYDGAFNSSSPSTNAVEGNDDTPDNAFPRTGTTPSSGISPVSCRGSTTLCPQVTALFDGGDQVTLVISTYSPGNSLGSFVAPDLTLDASNPTANQSASSVVGAPSLEIYAWNAAGDIATANSRPVATTFQNLNLDLSSVSNNITVSANGGSITGSGSLYTISGILSGSGPLSFLGSGTITLSGANTYNGSVTISPSSTVALSGTSSLGSLSSLEVNGAFNIGSTTSGTSIGTISGSGSIDLGAKTLTITNGNSTFNGAISGLGGLSVSGTSLELGGINTFTGGSQLTSGQLKINASGSLASGVSISSGTFVNQGSVNGASGAFSGSGVRVASGSTSITNTGSITPSSGGFGISNSGNITSLTNAQGGNSSSAATTALTYEGVLPNSYNIVVNSTDSYGQLFATDATGSITFSIDDSSTLESNTYINVLTGISSASLTTLTGIFGSYNWSLVETSMGSSSWNLVAALPIAPGTPANASNPYSTTFAGGTLLVDLPGSYSTDYTISSSGGTIDIAGQNSTFSGVFSGTGPITFSNTSSVGSVDLTAVNTYTGTTTVGSRASLYVNGSIASSSSLTVQSGGLVGGTGTLPTTTVNSGGRIAPGNSIGTLTVANLNLNGGTIEAEIQGPQNDLINVTNNVTNFTGTANLIAFGGGSPWPSFTYTIVDAPNSADFATSSSLTLDETGISSALLRAGTTLIQNADGNPKTFDVQWRPKNGTGATASAMQAIGQGGVNQLATAEAFDRVFQSLATNAANNRNNTGSLIGSTGFTTGQTAAAGISADFLTITSQLLALSSDSQLTAAINSLSAEPYAAFQSVGLDTLKRQRELLMSQAGNCVNTGWVTNAPIRKEDTAPKKPLCIYAQAANATSSINGSAGLSSYDSGIFSSFYGVEYQPSKKWTVGAAYGYGTAYLNNMALTNAFITSAVNSGSLYGVYKPSDRWNIRGLFGYANFNSSGSRNVAYIGNGSAIQGSPTGNGYTFAINADYLIGLSKASAETQTYLKPIVGIAWGGYQQNAFSESSGGALDLNVQGHTANSLVGTVGFELATSPIALNKSNTTAITPRLAVAYQVDALANDSGVKSITSSFRSAPAAGTFVAQGENRGVNALLVDGGLDLKVSKNASLYASVGYEVLSKGSQFTYGGGVKVRF
jgi:autotransporter-associated beta strand protein